MRDVLYDRPPDGPAAARQPAANCLLVDREIEPGDEPVKLCIRDGRIVDFRKARPRRMTGMASPSASSASSPAAAAELADRVGGLRGLRPAACMEYEEPIRDMILAGDPDRFGFEDVTGLPWTEIDFPEDVVKARALLPELVPSERRLAARGRRRHARALAGPSWR